MPSWVVWVLHAIDRAEVLVEIIDEMAERRAAGECASARDRREHARRLRMVRGQVQRHWKIFESLRRFARMCRELDRLPT